MFKARDSLPLAGFFRLVLLLAFGLATLLFGLGTTQVAQAATTPVGCTNTPADITALVAAINTTNSTPGTIDLTAGCTYTLTTLNNSTGGQGGNGLPAITGTVTINGNGATITRSSATQFRIFYVDTTGTLVINNLTISGGDSPANGGGILNNGGSVTLANSTLSGNSAYNGGGIINDGFSISIYSGNVTLTNSTISSNTATNAGGGILNNGASLTLTNSNISGNTAMSSNSNFGGGGIYNSNGSVTLTNSTLSSNSAANGGGGGIYTSVDVTLTNSTLSSNSAANGGGIYANGGIVTLTNSTLLGNTAINGTNGGGGIFNLGSMTLTNSTLSGNSTTNSSGGGGGIFNLGSMTLTNSTLSSNSAGGGGGGGIFNVGLGSVTLNNNLLVNNTAGAGGNCFNGNTVTGSGNQEFPSPSNSVGCSAAGLTAVAINPLGTNALANNGGPTQTIALPAGSSAIGATTTNCPATDQRGTTRANPCSIGAYEYVPTNITVGCTGTVGDVPALIAAIATPGTIDLAAGCTYTLTALNNTGVNGPNGLPVITGQVTINGNGATITRSSATQFRIFQVAVGGTLTTNNLTISGGNTGFGGGGIYNSGTVMLTNSTISGNTSTSSGGGIYNNGGSVTLTNSTLSGNSAGNGGGGIYNLGSVTLTNSTLSGNSATSQGGGIRNSGGSVTLTNSTLSGNSAGTGGGIVNTGTVTLDNNLFVNNTATTGGNCYNLSMYQSNGNLAYPADNSNCSLTVAASNPLGTNTLTNNGGPTQTIALPTGSPAIGAATANCPATDQRGTTRANPCSIGAYEYVAPTLTSIVVTPATPSIPAGTTQQFTATGHYSDNSTQDLTISVTWAISGTANTISNAGNAGLATAGSTTGSYTVRATSSAIEGTATLTVTTAILTSIVVTPAAPSIAAGTTQQFAATGHYSDNSTQNLTSGVTWAISGTNQINNAGLATAGSTTGGYTVRATSGAIEGTATLTVTAPLLTSIVVTPATPSIAAGTTQQFTATGHYSDNSTQDVTSGVTWAISGTNTISNAGLATAGSTNGSYTVRATSGAVSGTATLTVSTATLSSLAITPVNPTLVEWASQQFTATGTYSNNSTQNLTSSVTWSVDHSNVITVSNLVTNTGLVTAVGVGSAVLTGSSNGITATTTITVVSGLIVTDPFDNGSGAKPGTLSYALLHATSGQVISFTLTSGSTINVGNALPPVKAGVQILAPCSITGGPTITLDGGFQAINGLTLSGNNLLQGFKLKGFWGKGLIATTFGNKLKCMAVIR